ncbi:MAG: deaminase [Candidatus Vogelbacteria bacterium]
MTKAIVAYVPVLHEGYRSFFAKHPEVKTLYLLGNTVIERFRPLVKDIRRLDPVLMKKVIEALGVFKKIEIVENDGLGDIEETTLVMPDEDVSRDVVPEFFKDKKIIFDTIFLRWHRNNAVAEQSVLADQEISQAEFDKKMIDLAAREGAKSADWYRQVGGVVVRENKIILVGHNHHVPDEDLSNQQGDPRANFKQGIKIELSTSLHSEAGLIALAAKQGLSLEGAHLYITDFPCPPCAKLVAYSGIKKLYYHKGYGVLDGVSILKDQGVKIIWVK